MILGELANLKSKINNTETEAMALEAELQIDWEYCTKLWQN